MSITPVGKAVDKRWSRCGPAVVARWMAGGRMADAVGGMGPGGGQAVDGLCAGRDEGWTSRSRSRLSTGRLWMSGGRTGLVDAMDPQAPIGCGQAWGQVADKFATAGGPESERPRSGWGAAMEKGATGCRPKSTRSAKDALRRQAPEGGRHDQGPWTTLRRLIREDERRRSSGWHTRRPGRRCPRRSAAWPSRS